MADILIRDVPDEVLAAIDAGARRVGLSRTEFIRRILAREAADNSTVVTVGDLETFSQTFADLGDEDVMKRAWS